MGELGQIIAGVGFRIPIDLIIVEQADNLGLFRSSFGVKVNSSHAAPCPSGLVGPANLVPATSAVSRNLDDAETRTACEPHQPRIYEPDKFVQTKRGYGMIGRIYRASATAAARVEGCTASRCRRRADGRFRQRHARPVAVAPDLDGQGRLSFARRARQVAGHATSAACRGGKAMPASARWPFPCRAPAHRAPISSWSRREGPARVWPRG